MKRHPLIEKTNDVHCSRDTLETLNAMFLFPTTKFNPLDYLSCDVRVLERRSQMFHDTLKITGLYQLLENVVSLLEYIAQIVKLKSVISEADRGLFSLKQMNNYFLVIDSLSDFFERKAAQFTSPDYVELFHTILNIRTSEEYKQLRKNSSQLMEQIYRIKSVTVGFNLNAAFEPYEAGLLAINDNYVESGKVIDRILRLDTIDTRQLLSIAPIVPCKKECKKDEYESLHLSVYSAMGKIFKKQVRQWEPEFNKYMSDNLSFLIDLIPDIHFILNISKIQQKLIDTKMPLCVPSFHVMEEKVFIAQGLYNPTLAIDLFEKSGLAMPVKNSLSFDDNGQIFLLTGPNSGGKSVFLKAVGIAQIMAQIGMLVPAEKMEISPVSAIFVETPKMNGINGRLETECQTFQDIFEKINEWSLLLVDEAFSSTAPNEAITLILEVMKAMRHIKTRGIIASHFHSLADLLCGLNDEGNEGTSKFDFLVAGIEADEQRTYVIERRFPDGKSFAKSIANRYGISYEKLVGTVNE